MARLLIVEDEPNLAEGLCFNLEQEGHTVRAVDKAEDAQEIYPDFDMMLLDVMLPGMNGLEFLQFVRKHNPRYPVLILSAKTREEDKLNGFAAGADDYVTKPFSLPELILRIQRMLERQLWYERSTRDDRRYCFGEYWIDFAAFDAQTNRGSLKLTPYECYVMKYLIENGDRPVSRSELLEKVWGYSAGVETRTVDAFMVRLRKLFEPEPKSPVFIRTVRGVGYQFTK